MARAVAMERDFAPLRTGAASASLVDGVHVDHHGRRARLIEVGERHDPGSSPDRDPPWDPASLRAIGTAISQSRIGLTPTIDGPAIRLYVPAMTEERRRELVALVHKRADQARVEIRAAPPRGARGDPVRDRQRATDRRRRGPSRDREPPALDGSIRSPRSTASGGQGSERSCGSEPATGLDSRDARGIASTSIDINGR